MKNVYLTQPTTELRTEYLAFYNEWKQSGEDMIPWVIGKDPTDFESYVSFLENNAKGENLPAGWVPDSTFWLVDEDNNVLGAVNIRHDLTPKLFNEGGHIGYGIRPSQRQKGYATKLLALSLEKAKELGITRALVVCDHDNIASEKTIINNGAVRDEDYDEENGNVIKRFWIQVG